MLRIRQEQVDVFEQELLEVYINEMIDHARLYFPEPCASKDERQLREFIVDGIRKAHKYGIRTSRDITLFLNLMFVFGSDFDADPSLPWSERIFSGWSDGAVVSVDHLYERALMDLRGDYE